MDICFEEYRRSKIKKWPSLRGLYRKHVGEPPEGDLKFHVKASAKALLASHWEFWLEDRNLTVRAHYNMIKALRAAVQEQAHLGDQDGYVRASLRRERAACPEEHNTDHREVSAGKPVHPTAPSEPRDTREGLFRRVEERA